jgi:hypothetical protein
MDLEKLMGKSPRCYVELRNAQTISAKICYEMANNKLISGDRDTLEPGYEMIVARKINDSKFRDALTYISTVMLELFPASNEAQKDSEEKAS